MKIIYDINLLKQSYQRSLFLNYIQSEKRLIIYIFAIPIAYFYENWLNLFLLQQIFMIKFNEIKKEMDKLEIIKRLKFILWMKKSLVNKSLKVIFVLVLIKNNISIVLFY